MAEMTRHQAENVIRTVTGLSLDNPQALNVAMDISEALIQAVSVLSKVDKGEPCIGSD